MNKDTQVPPATPREPDQSIHEGVQHDRSFAATGPSVVYRPPETRVTGSMALARSALENRPDKK